jgi:hypothetical protein
MFYIIHSPGTSPGDIEYQQNFYDVLTFFKGKSPTHYRVIEGNEITDQIIEVKNV